MGDVNAYRHGDLAQQIGDVALLPADVGADDTGPFLGESFGGGPPDTRARASDDRDLARETAAHLDDPLAPSRARPHVRQVELIAQNPGTVRNQPIGEPQGGQEPFEAALLAL